MPVITFVDCDHGHPLVDFTAYAPAPAARVFPIQVTEGTDLNPAATDPWPAPNRTGSFLRLPVRSH
jgi:hypothetical protein